MTKSASRSASRALAIAAAWALVGMAVATVATACGETRGSIGEECLRDEDCLSGLCSARACVSAPTLIVGATSPPPDSGPWIFAVDAGAQADADAPADVREAAPPDAPAEGG